MIHNLSFTPKNYPRLVNLIKEKGYVITSDRGLTYEVINATLVHRRVVDRVDTNLWRKMNIAFAIAEFVSYVTGHGEVSYFTPFISTYGEFSTDGVTVDGAYGPRIIRGGLNAVDEVVKMLKASTASRRAVIPVYEYMDLFGLGGKNTPCTLSMQFLIRGGKLVMITTMRSNDIHYGLTNDLFTFSMLHEMIADRLEVPAGDYFHNAGSLHVYKDIEEKFASVPKDEAHWPYFMGAMKGALNDNRTIETLGEAIASVNDETAFASLFSKLNPYSQNLAAVCMTFAHRKEGDSRWYNTIRDTTLRRALRGWMVKVASEPEKV